MQKQTSKEQSLEFFKIVKSICLCFGKSPSRPVYGGSFARDFTLTNEPDKDYNFYYEQNVYGTQFNLVTINILTANPELWIREKYKKEVFRIKINPEKNLSEIETFLQGDWQEKLSSIARSFQDLT